MARSTSAIRILPLGPEPFTVARSTPFCWAKRRAAGTTCTRAPSARRGWGCLPGGFDGLLHIGDEDSPPRTGTLDLGQVYVVLLSQPPRCRDDLDTHSVARQLRGGPREGRRPLL